MVIPDSDLLDPASYQQFVKFGEVGSLLRNFILQVVDSLYLLVSCGSISLCEYNAAIKIAAELAGAEVADLAAQNLRYETLDGTHPTRAGHATIAQAWINCLGSIMPAGDG